MKCGTNVLLDVPELPHMAPSALNKPTNLLLWIRESKRTVIFWIRCSSCRSSPYVSSRCSHEHRNSSPGGLGLQSEQCGQFWKRAFRSPLGHINTTNVMSLWLICGQISAENRLGANVAFETVQVLYWSQHIKWIWVFLVVFFFNIFILTKKESGSSSRPVVYNSVFLLIIWIFVDRGRLDWQVTNVVNVFITFSDDVSDLMPITENFWLQWQNLVCRKMGFQLFSCGADRWMHHILGYLRCLEEGKMEQSQSCTVENRKQWAITSNWQISSYSLWLIMQGGQTLT